MQGMMDVLDELSCGEDERAEVALTRLSIWGPEIVEILQERLDNPEPDVRWWAVRGLAEIHDERVPEMLLKALADADKGVRWCAGLALRNHPSEKAVPALINLLSNEESLTRRLAGDALVAIGSPVVPRLLEVMQVGDLLARLEAVRALAKIGDESAIPTLFAALDDSSALIEYWANEGLEKMGVGMVFYNPE
ncbi:MAG TPA: HEAT repeat domain-containing protein [Anaerolineales bacterium]|nr:HEAT repeat domain-containing protein [Anaerolineales bacterium]